MQHIPVLHDVVFAFEAEDAFGAGVGFGAGFEQLVPADGFGADEMLFEIRMNGSGGLGGAGVHGDGPGAAFVFAGGEEREYTEVPSLALLNNLCSFSKSKWKFWLILG